MSDNRESSAQVEPRSFIDLRRFVADPTKGIAVSQPGMDPFLGNRRLLDLPPGPVTIGAIALQADEGSVAQQAADEFVIVCNGAITFSQSGQSVVLNEGESIVLPRGADFQWRTEGPASLLFMRCEGEAPDASTLVPIMESPPLEPSGPPLAELLVGPTPQCRNYTDYRSASGEFVCGTWDSTPYHRTAMPYRHYELMYLLEGSVTFVDETGRSGTFRKHDIFLLEQHAKCSWESRENVTKVYAIYRPV